MKKDKKSAVLTFVITAISIAIMVWCVIVGVNGSLMAKNIILGLDLQGGASITYEAQEGATSQKINDAIKILQKRVESYSTEASVYQEGDNRIVVDIPGVSNDTEIFDSLSEVGELQFVTVDDEVVLTGDHVKNASAEVSNKVGESGKYVVNLSFDSVGKTKFAEITKEHRGEALSIVYNGNSISSPKIDDVITNGAAVISGTFTKDKAEELATYIRIGALPVSLTPIRSSSVGAQLGTNALQSSLFAGMIGLIIVVLFMIIVYRVPGVASSIALAIYVGLTLLLLNVLNITLTLPGIAGIILSIGMAVDANVVIFTRIKEEIVSGRNVRDAITAGFDKAMSAIIDGNVTTLIAAVVLGFLGSGTVKGFAYTLGLGIVVSLFTALIITKSLVWAFYRIGIRDKKFYANNVKLPTIAFIKHKAKYFILSGVLIIAVFVSMCISKAKTGEIFAYGLDFVGGTSMTITFSEDNIPTNSELEKVFGDEGIAASVAPVANSSKIVVKCDDLSKKLDQETAIKKTLESKYGVTDKEIESETISGTVSGEMKKNAVVAVAVSIVAMLIYIWFRFKKLSFAIGSIIPLIHDVIIVLGVYVVTQISVGNTFIACLLTILGYSINSTIVIFDRIRESNAQIKSEEDKVKLVNEAISSTLTRSINTSLTTFIMVLVLYILGVEAIQQFTLPLMAGIIAGAYSSVCIAGTIWFILDKKVKKKPIDPKKEKMNKKIKESKDKILV